MSDSAALEEIVDDAKAYLAVGDIDNAVAVLFEGLAANASEDVQAGVENAVGSLCRSLWDAKNLEGGKIAARAAVGEILKCTGEAAEPEYADLYATALAETGSSPFPLRRLYRHRNLMRVFAKVVKAPEGHIAECGCARGLSSLELCLTFRKAHSDWQGVGYHVFDSFEGLSPPTEKDAIDWASGHAALVAANMVAGHFAVTREVVARNLHRLFPLIELHPGWIPDVFATQPERSYRFVHIDVDLYQPTIDSLKYFFPRLSPGGIVITDDYDWPGAHKAFDEFAAQHALELYTTDTNQAFFVKGAER